MALLTFILFFLLSTSTFASQADVNDATDNEHNPSVVFDVDEANGVQALSCDSRVIIATFKSFVAVQSARLQIFPGLSHGNITITGTTLAKCLHISNSHEGTPKRVRRNVERIETSALAIRFFLVAGGVTPRRRLGDPWWAPQNPASPTAPPSTQSARIESLNCPFFTHSNGMIQCAPSVDTLPQCFLHSTLFRSTTTNVDNYATNLLSSFCGITNPCPYFFVKNETTSATMMYLCNKNTTQTTQPTQTRTTKAPSTTSPSTSPPSSLPSFHPTNAPSTSPSTNAPSAKTTVSPSFSASAAPTVQPTNEPTMVLDWSHTFMFMNITIENTTILAGSVRFQKSLQKAAEQSLYYATREVSRGQNIQPPNVNELQVLLEKVDDRPLVSFRRRQLLQQTMKLTFRIGAQKRLFLDFIVTFVDQIVAKFASNLAQRWGDSTLSTGSKNLSPITTVTRRPASRVRPWWEQFVTAELIVVLLFIPVVALIILLGFFYECACGSKKVEATPGIETDHGGQYRAINIIKFGFLTFNTITDVAFAWSLLGQNQLLLLGLSVLFIVIPFVGSLYAWLRTKRRFREELHFASWEERFDMPFIILSILCGSTFGAFLLVHSRLFRMDLFSMNLTVNEQLDFLSQRLVYTVMIEDIPQFAIQIASVVLLRGELNGITAAAFFASIISIVVGIYNAVNKSEQLRHSLTLQSTTVETKQLELVETTSPQSTEGGTTTGQTEDGEGERVD